jgi:predicted small metal-binding protein
MLGTNLEEVTNMIDRLERDTASLAEMVLSPTRLYRDERLYDLLQEAMGASQAVAATGLGAGHHGAGSAPVDVLRTRMQHIRDDLGLLIQAHQMRCQTLQAQVHARQAEIGTRQNDDMENQMALAVEHREEAMPKVINCSCGHVIFGADDEELIQNALIHMREFHPAMVGKISTEDLLEMAEDAS